MVGRAFLEALRFGAPGGAALGIPLPLMPTSPGEVNVFGTGLVPAVVIGSIGALIGLVIAYVALLAASISTDVTSRPVGVVVALCVTFAGSSLLLSGAAVVPAAYAAIVAWFRIPRIVGLGG